MQNEFVKQHVYFLSLGHSILSWAQNLPTTHKYTIKYCKITVTEINVSKMVAFLQVIFYQLELITFEQKE